MKTLLIASFGGHLEQLERIAKYLELKEQLWVTTKPQATVNPRYVITDFNKHNCWRAIACAIDIYHILRDHSFDLAISSGAAPGLLFLLVARLKGIHTIWIDSIANSQKLSLSGRLASRFCHVTLTQWPEIALKNDKVSYAGSVL